MRCLAPKQKPTLVKRWGDRAFHPSRVIVYHVDSEVGMPMGYDFHRPMTLSPLGMYKHNKTLENSQHTSFINKEIPECTGMNAMGKMMAGQTKINID